MSRVCVSKEQARANFAGVLCATVTGLIVDKTGHFSGAFAITAVIMLIGGFAWVFGVGRLEQKDCSPQSEASRATVGAEA